MLNVQCDVNISLARELPPLTLRCMTHGAVRNDPVHDEVSVLVPQIDPSVPQPVFTITEKALLGPSKGPLSDCTTSPLDRFATLVSTLVRNIFIFGAKLTILSSINCRLSLHIQ